MSQILPYELFSIANAALEDSFKLEDEDSFDEFLDKLRFFFQDNLLLAALDLVDRDNVIKFTTAWGYTQYQVLGTTSTYTVFLGAVTVDGNRKTPPYCTCASFAYSVLLSEYQLMCKHLLAVVLARRMSRCIERPVNPDDLAQVSVAQMSEG